MSATSQGFLNVNSVESIYGEAILALQGVSLSVPDEQPDQEQQHRGEVHRRRGRPVVGAGVEAGRRQAGDDRGR